MENEGLYLTSLNLEKNGIRETYYLSNEQDLDFFLEFTGLDLDEVEQIVGRFKEGHARAGELKGEFVVNMDNSYYIRHHFTKKVLWRP